jgi:hypothetical protein
LQVLQGCVIQHGGFTSFLLRRLFYSKRLHFQESSDYGWAKLARQWRPHGENMKNKGKKGCTMGDKGKKDKEKGQKQNVDKKQQKDKKKVDKQPKRTP